MLGKGKGRHPEEKIRLDNKLVLYTVSLLLVVANNGALLFFSGSQRGEGLSKTAIGDYLGEKSPFHEQVLKAFVDLHDFTDLIIVQALR